VDYSCVPLELADDIPFVADKLGILRTEYWYPFDFAIHAGLLLFGCQRSPQSQKSDYSY
jgi:hypothetical protein